MPDQLITIKVTGIEKLLDAFSRFPVEIMAHFSQAAHESSNKILGEEGLRNYPPSTAANAPPTPYYIRGRGTQYESYNKGQSENLGKQWYRKREGYSVKIGNRASYAKWVHGDETQAHFMADIGWRKLLEVAKEKILEIERIYQKWIDRAIRKLRL